MITGDKITKQARTWLGTKYHHQGRLKKTETHFGGADCFGLIMGVAKELKIQTNDGKLLHEYDETDYSAYPDSIKFKLKDFLDRHLVRVAKNHIKPGDVLMFKIFEYPQHLGIATDFSDRELGVIHCYSGSGQVVEHLLSPAWERMLVGVYRFRRRV